MNKNCLKNKFGKIAFAVALAFAGTAMAQENEATTQNTDESKKVDTAAIMKTALNARGGINFSSFGSRSVFGFHVGGMVDIPLTLVDIANDAYLIEVHPGAQFIKKGGRLWRRYDDYYLLNYHYFLYRWEKVDAYYLEVPVPFSIKRNISNNVAARADFGPYIAFGLFGTKDAFDYLSRFDAGVMYGIAFDFSKRYNLAFHAGTGLSEDNISTLYITLGYKL